MAPLSAREFFRLELGLFFLTQHVPGQPVTDLRHVLDGYLSPAAGTESSIRWLRHRMGKSARTGQWRVRLNEYCKIPAYLRLFELIDPGAQRVCFPQARQRPPAQQGEGAPGRVGHPGGVRARHTARTCSSRCGPAVPARGRQPRQSEIPRLGEARRGGGPAASAPPPHARAVLGHCRGHDPGGEGNGPPAAGQSAASCG